MDHDHDDDLWGGEEPPQIALVCMDNEISAVHVQTEPHETYHCGEPVVLPVIQGLGVNRYGHPISDRWVMVNRDVLEALHEMTGRLLADPDVHLYAEWTGETTEIMECSGDDHG